MLKLIVGNKGSGKTKVLLDAVHESLKTETGNIVFIEHSANLRFELPHKIRLIDASEYKINSMDSFYGFVAGMCSGNYDITNIFVDGILKTVGRDYDKLGELFGKLSDLPCDVKFLITVSEDMEKLPESVTKYVL
jgi:Flp pilus assembly protein, ATPase CpaF